MMETSAMSIVRRCLRPGSAWLTALLLLMAMVCASMGVAHAAETITYYYTSPQGTVLAKADASGNILSSADYRPYGTQALGTPEQGPGYTGHVNDVDSGLVYMQARYYDPDLGRFTSTDPATLAVGDIYGFSRYSYVGNNPSTHVDPDGRQCAQCLYYPGDTAKQAAINQGASGKALASVAVILSIVAPELGPELLPATAAVEAGGLGEASADVVAAVESADAEVAADSAASSQSAFPDRPLPRDVNGRPTPDPDATGPYSQLGRQSGRRGDYDQAREFDREGNPVRDVDFTDHGRPSQHTDPHEHQYVPNPTGGTPQHGPAQPLPPTPTAPIL